MHPPRFRPLILLLLLTSCARPMAERYDPNRMNNSLDPLRFKLVQKTCALFVAPHTAALGPVGFGRDIDDDMVRWNTCPGGTLVACKVTTTASGDTLITGLPKPADRSTQDKDER
ncbi:MAG: hypothetical protein R2811_05205 [Flavobacteriales bacterium]